MSETVLPHAKALRDMLEELLGQDVDLQVGPPVVPSRVVKSAVGVYVDERLGLRAIVVADLALAAFAGACVGLVPKAGARASVEDGKLAPNLAENVAEMVNIMAALFNLDGHPHVRLDGFHLPGEDLPADVARLSAAYVNRLDLVVTISGYGTGRLSIVLA